jgi:hypothetical protein
LKLSFGNSYSGISQRKTALNAGKICYNNELIDYGYGENEAKKYIAQNNSGIIMEEGCSNSIQNVQ